MLGFELVYDFLRYFDEFGFYDDYGYESVVRHGVLWDDVFDFLFLYHIRENVLLVSLQKSL